MVSVPCCHYVPCPALPPHRFASRATAFRDNSTVSAFHRFDRAPGPKTHDDVHNVIAMQTKQAQQSPSYRREFAFGLGHIHSPSTDEFQHQ
jgi:hypothetical protein